MGYCIFDYSNSTVFVYSKVKVNRNRHHHHSLQWHKHRTRVVRVLCKCPIVFASFHRYIIAIAAFGFFANARIIITQNNNNNKLMIGARFARFVCDAMVFFCAFSRI